MKAGWKTVKLSEIALIGAGNSAPQETEDFSEDGPLFVRTSDVGEVKFGTVVSANDRLSPRGAKGMRLWKSGTILIPKSGASTFVNHRVILGTDAHVSSHLATITADTAKTDPRFLLYYLSTVRAQDLIQDQSYPSLKLPEIGSIEIPLPPLAEQKRIVALLDEAFAGIDEAKAKAQASIQSLGTLVVSEFQSLVDEKGFERKPLPELASHTLGKMLDKKKNTGTTRPYLRNVNVRWFEFDLSDIHEMPIRDEEAARCQARKGDVLMCEGGYPGRCAIWRSDEPVFFQKALHRIRFNEKWMAEWFVNFMHSLDSSGKISEFFTGTGIQHLTGETLSKLEIPVPPKSEIEAYVKKISAIRDETNDLSANESAKLDALSELKTSLLAQAFAGELTA